MIDAPRSPSEYYVRFLISRANVDDFKPTEILDEMAGLALDGLNSVYIERLKGRWVSAHLRTCLKIQEIRRQGIGFDLTASSTCGIKQMPSENLF